MGFLATLKADIAALAPIALTVVSTVEKTMASAGGATKKSIAVDLVSNLAKAAEGSGNVTAEGIGELVDTLVAVLNATGLFSHGATAAAPKA